MAKTYMRKTDKGLSGTDWKPPKEWPKNFRGCYISENIKVHPSPRIIYARQWSVA